MTAHQRIILNGDGYSDEWVKEAERRGLPNIRCMIDAAGTLTTEKSVRLFEKFGIFTKAELISREEIIYETYAKTLNIEALTMINMANKKIIPAVIRYSKSLADTVIAVKDAGADASVQRDILNTVSSKLITAKNALLRLEEATAQAGTITSAKEKAFFYKDTVKVEMDALRKPVDELELIVDKSMWPMPTYGDLTFEV